MMGGDTQYQWILLLGLAMMPLAINSADASECITDCVGRPDGHYQSCEGCAVYASCSGGTIIDNRPCGPGNLVWDNRVKRCERISSTCSEDIDDCVGVSCNQGSCIDALLSHTCDCDAGWEGAACDANIDDCVRVSCNQGSCVDAVLSHTCDCDAGWEGAACDDIDDCVSVSCNQGSCVDAVLSHTCDCDAGWKGAACDRKVCDRQTKGDVVFIVDKSGSIGYTNWAFQIDALKDLVDHFFVGENNIQFGAVGFSTISNEEFVLDQHMTNAAVNTALEKITYTRASTNIASGFREARFVFGKAGNRAGVNDIAVLFTDGIANEEESNTDTEVLNLKNAGVDVMTVGIGTNHDSAAVRGYASQESWYFTADTYEGLVDVINDIGASICEEMKRN